jgi:hypothetical protein
VIAYRVTAYGFAVMENASGGLHIGQMLRIMQSSFRGAYINEAIAFALTASISAVTKFASGRLHFM